MLLGKPYMPNIVDIVNKVSKINSTVVIKSLLRAIFQTDTLEDFDKLIDKLMGVK